MFVFNTLIEPNKYFITNCVGMVPCAHPHPETIKHTINHTNALIRTMHWLNSNAMRLWKTGGSRYDSRDTVR
ncbi:MAG: hypothetical protein ACRCX1_01910 [Bacteroidales bacterium]